MSWPDVVIYIVWPTAILAPFVAGVLFFALRHRS